MSSTPSLVPGFRVERTYTNFVTGETRTEVLPKAYKTERGAEACAQRNRWITMPDPHTRIDTMSARVITAPKGVK